MRRLTTLVVVALYVLTLMGLPRCSPGDQPDIDQQDTARPS